MSTVEQACSELILFLPADLHEEVRDFAEFLLKRRQFVNEPSTSEYQRNNNKLQQHWAGALRDIDRTTSSVDLQHYASNLMAEIVLRSVGDNVSH